MNTLELVDTDNHVGKGCTVLQDEDSSGRSTKGRVSKNCRSSVSGIAYPSLSELQLLPFKSNSLLPPSKLLPAAIVDVDGRETMLPTRVGMFKV